MKAIDLTQYADRYKLGWDEAAEILEQSTEDRAWLRLIPCRFGKIFPSGEKILAAYVVGAKKAKQAERLPFVTMAQGGGPGCSEIVVTFSPERFDEMAVFMAARTRRRLSPEQRARLSRASAPYRFTKYPVQTGSSSGEKLLDSGTGPRTSADGERGHPEAVNSASAPWSEGVPS